MARWFDLGQDGPAVFGAVATCGGVAWGEMRPPNGHDHTTWKVPSLEDVIAARQEDILDLEDRMQRSSEAQAQ
jgi:hypothetical protein